MGVWEWVKVGHGVGMEWEGWGWRDGDEKDRGRDRHRRTRMEGQLLQEGWGRRNEALRAQAGAGGLRRRTGAGRRCRRIGQQSRSRQEVQERGDGCAVAAGSHLQVWVTQRDQEAPAPWQVRVEQRWRTLLGAGP